MSASLTVLQANAAAAPSTGAIGHRGQRPAIPAACSLALLRRTSHRPGPLTLLTSLPQPSNPAVVVSTLLLGSLAIATAAACLALFSFPPPV